MKKSIVILSAGITNVDGVWQSTGFYDDEKWGAPGGALRVLAGSILYKKNPNQLVISCGGKGYDIRTSNIDRPIISKIISDELIKMGVNRKNIIEENKSNTTFESLCYIVEDIKKYMITDIDIISNRYHIERIKEFIKNNIKLNNIFSNINTNILSAEDIVTAYDPNKWQNEINKIYISKEMNKRIEKEKKGIDDIKNGTYKY